MTSRANGNIGAAKVFPYKNASNRLPRGHLFLSQRCAGATGGGASKIKNKKNNICTTEKKTRAQTTELPCHTMERRDKRISFCKCATHRWIRGRVYSGNLTFCIIKMGNYTRTRTRTAQRPVSEDGSVPPLSLDDPYVLFGWINVFPSLFCSSELAPHVAHKKNYLLHIV